MVLVRPGGKSKTRSHMTVKRDLISVKRDLMSVKRDLGARARQGRT